MLLCNPNMESVCQSGLNVGRSSSCHLSCFGRNHVSVERGHLLLLYTLSCRKTNIPSSSRPHTNVDIDSNQPDCMYLDCGRKQENLEKPRQTQGELAISTRTDNRAFPCCETIPCCPFRHIHSTTSQGGYREV